VGLSSLLSNLEAAAQGQASPPRFLMMFWPTGTVPNAFRPTGVGRNYQTSPVLAPFEAAGLREDTIVLYGLADRAQATGGGEEGGVVLRTTGADIPGTRANGGEGDDAVAGGPSFDQIFLENAPQLGRVRPGYANAIGDARVSFNETSTRCLSYGYQTRSVESAGGGSNIEEHTPLLPELSPAQLFAQVFAAFMPGGSNDTNAAEALRALKLRKSVLDYSLGELKTLAELAPASERPRLDVHADAIRKVELQLSQDIQDGSAPGCSLPLAPDPAFVAASGSFPGLAFTEGQVDESVAVAKVGELHLSVIRAAFQCDALRVATFQWASATDLVAFAGMMPDQPERIFRHYDITHRVTNVQGTVPGQESLLGYLANVHTWYNQRTADFLRTLKDTPDIFGNSLLDHTVVPFVTEMSGADHRRDHLPALIFGGKALGMQGGQYQNFESAPRPFNDFWLSIAQAYFPDAEDVRATLADQRFAQNLASFSGPIAELWQRPA
jgi:hypothetical protein